MAKQKSKESPEKQFERFRQKVEDMVRDGELNPTEADERFERAMDKLLPPDDPD